MPDPSLPGLVTARLAIAEIEGQKPWSREAQCVFDRILERLNEMIAAETKRQKAN